MSKSWTSLWQFLRADRSPAPAPLTGSSSGAAPPGPGGPALRPVRTVGVVDAGAAVAEGGRRPVRLLVTPDGNAFRLRLIGPLDPRQPREREIRHLFPRGELDVQFEVARNFDADARALMQVFHDRLATTDFGRAVSTAPELELMREDQMLDFLEEIARQGYYMFRDLFSVEGMLALEADKDAIRGAVGSLLDRPQLISVESSQPLFPWAFLYDRPPADTLAAIRPERFWGFRHEIQVRLDESPTSLDLPGPPDIGTAICPVVDGHRHEAPGHPLGSHCAVTRLPSTAQLRQALENFDRDCFYFYGHAGSRAQNDPWLELNNQKLHLRDLKTPGGRPSLRFQRKPVVVFLNGCATAPVGSFRTDTPLGYLFEHGKYKLCCLGSVGKVPGPFAAEFARHFWQAFLGRAYLGTALRDARTKMMETWKNPLGLLYALFGDADTQVVPG